MKQVSWEIQRGAYSYMLEETPAPLFPWEIHFNAFKISHLITWSLWLLHTIVHFALAYRVQREGPFVPWLLWIALIADVVLTIPEAVAASTIAMAFFSGKAAQRRPDYRLCGPAAPLVDIMITCCGEPVEIILNTIAAAAAQDYPIESVRVFVLDDGHDSELRHAVDKLKLKLRLDKPAGPPVIYLSRPVVSGEPSHYKSGNLRYGIEQSQRLGAGSEFFAGLDADMIPEPDWLSRMVPHLLLHDEVALACGPQVSRVFSKRHDLPHT